MYELKGESASNIQIFITDSTRHFVTANLYFNTRPKPDSLAPAVDYIKKDFLRNKYSDAARQYDSMYSILYSMKNNYAFSTSDSKTIFPKKYERQAKASMTAEIGKYIDEGFSNVILYDKDPVKFITNALSPAKDIKVTIKDENKKEALAVVGDNNLSLAIGKRGQNVKLASRLTHYKIEVKSQSAVNEENADWYCSSDECWPTHWLRQAS
jgi:hypothetical protein